MDTRVNQDVQLSADATPHRTSARVRALRLVAIAVVLGGAGYAAYWALAGSKSVSTDNAYAGADLAQITPLVAGNVVKVNVEDTQTVRAGDVLVELDRSDAAINVASAQANYDRTVRTIRQTIATNRGLALTVKARQIDLDRARADLSRRTGLTAGGDISGEELAHIRDTVTAAKAALDTAKAQYEAGEAVTAGLQVDNHPDVLKAKATLDQAVLDMSRTIIKSPIDGVVSRRNVQVGQRLVAGSAIMTVVPLNRIYVDANFKEVQLDKVRIGQKATLTADIYGDGFVYHGRVIGFSGGTGSAFSLIPAQNATGNWIKVVQRVPVRIAIDPNDLVGHPLTVGMSLSAKIDVTDQSGPRPGMPAAAPATASR